MAIQLCNNALLLAQANELALAGLQVAAGTDLVHLPTFRLSCTSYFIRRGYTAAEIAYCERFADSAVRYASTWAAKEAVYKAIKQTDADLKLWWRDIEITRAKPQGKPGLSIKKLTSLPEISLSITHDGDYVWAIAMYLYNSSQLPG